MTRVSLFAFCSLLSTVATSRVRWRGDYGAACLGEEAKKNCCLAPWLVAAAHHI